MNFLFFNWTVAFSPFPFFSEQAKISWIKWQFWPFSEDSWKVKAFLLYFPVFSCTADSSIGDLVTHSLSEWGTFLKTQQQSDPRDLRPLRHLIRMISRHDLTKKKTMTKTKAKTKTITKTNTIGKNFQKAIQETCDLWNIWSEWWEDLTWPKKLQWQRQRQWQRQIHF